jgi:TPR repeat protein
MFQAGLGVEVDGPRALEWYLKAAEQGHAIAYNNLGTIYHVGMPGVAADPAKARECYKKAVQLGFDMVPEQLLE